MNKEQVFGIIRHGLTFVGALLMISGKVDESQWYELTGAVISLASVVWSIWDKRTVTPGV
jgi:hypothetical protein